MPDQRSFRPRNDIEDNMTEPLHPPEQAPPKKTVPETEEPGLLDSYGSFPVWMLKIIALATPDFLIRKAPAEKKPPQD